MPSLSGKGLHDGLKHEPVVVRESDVELLQLNFGRPTSLLGLLRQVDQTFARCRISIPDFEVDRDGVDDGQSRLLFGAENARKHFGVVQIAGERPLGHVRPIGDDRGRPEDDGGRVGLRRIGDDDDLRVGDVQLQLEDGTLAFNNRRAPRNDSGRRVEWLLLNKL